MNNSTPKGDFLFSVGLGCLFACTFTIDAIIEGATLNEWAASVAFAFVVAVFVYGLVTGISTLLLGKKPGAEG